MLNDFEEVNRILAEMADAGIVEPMAEPCDCADAHPLDWAEIVGCWDEVVAEMYPEA